MCKKCGRTHYKYIDDLPRCLNCGTLGNPPEITVMPKPEFKDNRMPHNQPGVTNGISTNEVSRLAEIKIRENIEEINRLRMKCNLGWQAILDVLGWKMSNQMFKSKYWKIMGE